MLQCRRGRHDRPGGEQSLPGGSRLAALQYNRRMRPVTLLAPHPITLTGQGGRREPLSEAHVPDLAAVGQDEDIWAFMPYTPVRSEADMLALVRELLARQA